MRKRRVAVLGLAAVAAMVVAGCTPWATQNVPSGTPDLTGISCPSTTHCVAVGGAILTTDDGGTTWVSHPGFSAGTVSCPTTNFCMAIGSSILTTSDGGSTWVSQPPPSGVSSLTSVSCPSQTHCVAVGGGAVLTTDDGGATWVSQTLPSSVTAAVASVSCPSTTFCMAGGGGGISGGARPNGVIPAQVVTTNDGGTTWVLQADFDAIVTSVTCASTSTCLVGGLNLPALSAALFDTTDGGATWTSSTVQPSSSPSGNIVYGVSCAPTTTCVAVGGDVSPIGPPPLLLASIDGGADWTSPTIPNGVTTLNAVSCPSPESCVAVGENAQSGGVIIRTG